MTAHIGPLTGMSAVKLALLAQQAHDDSASTDVRRAEPIAIVGIGCRFPGGADSPERFWDVAGRGVDAITEIPAGRWSAEALYDRDPATPGRMATRWGGFVDGLEAFDAAYFGIPPREAARIDPQQRLLLEVAVEAFERAGIPAERLAGTSTGVFVGATMSDYAERHLADIEAIDAYAITGNLHFVLANRLSFLLDLHGPSVAVDTACSSSLVALHLACRSLRDRESDLALAAGVNVVLTPEPTVGLSKWGVMAGDGRCKTFDAAADGFVRAEGAGAVVLKRLADALAAGDPIAAVIRGSAVNQDGRSTAMSAPNGLAQQAVVRHALSDAQVLPAQIGFVETHGTGTVLGDPIEVEALAEVLGAPDADAGPVLLGAVKTNVGHLEAAAGMAGLIRTVLCLQHELIPPPLHFRTLNPHMSLAGTRLEIPTAPRPWPSGATPRLAGISSFGFGGTNAHVIVEAAPRRPLSSTSDAAHLLVVSGRSEPALRDAASALADRIDASADDELGAICATAARHRTHHDLRAAAVGADRADLVDALRAIAAGERRATAQRRPASARQTAGRVRVLRSGPAVVGDGA